MATTRFVIMPQRGKMDCCVASMSMLFNRSYEEVLIVAARIAPRVLKSGLWTTDMLRIGQEFGYRLRRRLRNIDLDEMTGILSVRYRKERIDHAVFLTNGLVFDPELLPAVWDAETYVKKHKLKVLELLEEE